MYELKRLSDDELLAQTKKLVGNERELLVRILHHLKEIDSRKTYLHRGFASLWAYCTGELGYSEGSAQRRIEAMRALRELPILEKKIESGELSLSNVARAQSMMRKAGFTAAAAVTEKKLEIFSRLENKTQKEAEFILASEFPDVVTKESIRAVDGVTVEIKLQLPKEVLEKLEEAMCLLSHKNANPTWAEKIEMLSDFVIAKKVTAKKVRRLREVANDCCEYVDHKTGRRCEGRHKLEVEHLVPRAFGGGDEITNLKIYCRAHNVQAARDATLM